MKQDVKKQTSAELVEKQAMQRLAGVKFPKRLKCIDPEELKELEEKQEAKQTKEYRR